MTTMCFYNFVEFQNIISAGPLFSNDKRTLLLDLASRGDLLHSILSARRVWTLRGVPTLILLLRNLRSRAVKRSVV